MKKDVKRKKSWSSGNWLLLIAVLLVVLVSVPVINEMVPRRVKVRYISFDGVVESEYETRAHRVSDFLAEHEYEIADSDMVFGLMEEAATKPTVDDLKAGLRNVYMYYTGQLEKREEIFPYKGGFRRTAGSMRGTAIKADVAAQGSGGESDEPSADAYETQNGPAADAHETQNEPAAGASGNQSPEQDAGADAFITEGMTIEIKKAETAAAKIGGEKVKLVLYPGTVEETLKYNGVEWDEDDIIKPALEDKLGFDDKIKITRVDIVTEEKKETIEPVEEGAVFDKGLASGTIVRTEGKPGKAVYKYTYKYVNGKKKKTKKEFDRWVKKPTNIQLRFGTSVTGETGAVDFSETFTGNCTAYYFGNNAHGATGGRCHYGTCAVDPKVIPYGTKLYVEGYGTAVANDCGGAVKGHIIDLYMRSTKECFSWGRRNKKVYVLR